MVFLSLIWPFDHFARLWTYISLHKPPYIVEISMYCSTIKLFVICLLYCLELIALPRSIKDGNICAPKSQAVRSP